jgi:hypothetical protein
MTTKGERVTSLLRTRPVILLAALASLLLAGLGTAAQASAFSETYGFYEIANNGYVQSANAHTFLTNAGAGSTGGRLACQLFNSKNANEVAHGNGSCSVFYGGGEFVWARVYNETGATEQVGGVAET